MDAEWAAAIAAVGGAGGAFVTALGTLILWRWKNSGSVDTTTADKLWAENEALKKDYRRQIVELREEMVAQERRCAAELERVREDHDRLLQAHARELLDAQATINVLKDEARARAVVAAETMLKLPEGR